jgi:hypothetical protein
MVATQRINLFPPKTGGYFEIEKMLIYLKILPMVLFVGSPNVGQLLGGKKMGIITSLDYFQYPSDLDAIGIFGATGTKDYNLSNHFLCSIVTNWY